MKIRLSASQVASADDCRRLHWYKSVAKVRLSCEAANLAFGKCIDLSVREYLENLALGCSLPDPVARFTELWADIRARKELYYAATQTPRQFENMGKDLMSQFPNAWESTGFQVARDINGQPMLDRRLEVYLGSELGIELAYDGIIDVIVYTRDARLAIVDIKTSSAMHSMIYSRRSDQLTSYQMLFEAHRQKLGLPSVERLGFHDFLKRKVSSKIEPPVMVPVRSRQEIAEYRQKCFWLADDIRKKRFPKVSRLQYNTPCELCDYSQHCIYGDTENLVFSKKSNHSH